MWRMELCHYFSYYHWIDASVGVLLVPEGIIHPVVSGSALSLFNRYTCYWNLQFLNNESIIKTKVPPSSIGDLSRIYVGTLIYLLAKPLKLFRFPTFRFWEYLMKVIPEMCCAHWFWYLRFIVWKWKTTKKPHW